ncbi:Glycosyltransferase involved in cell wall bisynthesis [Ectothiorhodospira magna]|uniref:Glycosyltransferase involved in cell wall bisynthesis n=1 Tax=Ectothiorhodospira magna TaxID=867345 RepID=A0A1H9D393_9GAMM|nr:glycosyltransferase family 1 protein [Ectothiorhodospira magna]SEQ07942.1 Glycosyltransferase involved in cell wall bisynthesis [Ectothiorhodospira magna]
MQPAQKPLESGTTAPNCVSEAANQQPHLVAVPRRCLRIAMVTETFPPEINGVAHTLRQMVHSMLERGHAVHLIRPRQGKKDHGTLTPQENLREQLTPGLPIPGYPGLHFGLPARGAIRKAWCTHPPDVIYVATEGLLGGSALSAARSLGIPVISGFHTNFHRYSQYYGLGFMAPVISGFLRRFHSRTDCTLVPTDTLQAELQQQGFGTCRILARGVDTRLFNPARRRSDLRAQWGLEPNDPAVIYVGRLAAEKNLQLAVEAFRAMQVHQPRARFILVGDGPAAAELREQHPDLILAGVHIGEDLAGYYASGDIFLFPSISDTFGNVVLEAMASGLAVVSYNYAAGRQHLRHGESGLLAHFDDAEHFRQLATELVVDPDIWRRLGIQARAEAETVDWRCEHDRLEALFLEFAQAK